MSSRTLCVFLASAFALPVASNVESQDEPRPITLCPDEVETEETGILVFAVVAEDSFAAIDGVPAVIQILSRKAFVLKPGSLSTGTHKLDVVTGGKAFETEFVVVSRRTLLANLVCLDDLWPSLVDAGLLEPDIAKSLDAKSSEALLHYLLNDYRATQGTLIGLSAGISARSGNGIDPTVADQIVDRITNDILPALMATPVNQDVDPNDFTSDGVKSNAVGGVRIKKSGATITFIQVDPSNLTTEKNSFELTKRGDTKTGRSLGRDVSITVYSRPYPKEAEGASSTGFPGGPDLSSKGFGNAYVVFADTASGDTSLFTYRVVTDAALSLRGRTYKPVGIIDRGTVYDGQGTDVLPTDLNTLVVYDVPGSQAVVKGTDFTPYGIAEAALDKEEIVTYKMSFVEVIYVLNAKTQRTGVAGIVEYSYTLEMTAGESADTTTGKVTLGTFTITPLTKDTGNEVQKKFNAKVQPALTQFEKDKITFNKSQWKQQ